MPARLLQGSLVCVAMLVAAACTVDETPDDAVSIDSADGGGTEVAGVLQPRDVDCAVARRDTTVRAEVRGGTIVTAYAQFMYPADAYEASDDIKITWHRQKNGVKIKPAPDRSAQLLLNYQMCRGPGNPVYYYHIGNVHHPARTMDTTWLAGVVLGKDFDETLNQASVLPSLQIPAADTSAIRGGFVIVSN